MTRSDRAELREVSAAVLAVTAHLSVRDVLQTILSAVRRYSVFDHLATSFAFIGFSVPTFFTGLVLILIFSVGLGWLPFIYRSSVQVHDLPSLIEQIKQSIMPIAVLALFHGAALVRYTRASMLDRSRSITCRAT